MKPVMKSENRGNRGERPFRVLITAGPTREYIDPFRFISNPATGKMGYACARAASRQGWDVILISGPSDVAPPPGVKYIPVTSAREMREAVATYSPDVDAVIMAAAVADYRPEKEYPRKLKKGEDRLTVDLVRNPDILEELGRKKDKRILVGFSAQTDNDIDKARQKLKSKNLDLIISNNISSPGSGFGTDTNQIVLIERDGTCRRWPLLEKDEVARRIIKNIEALRFGRM